MFLTREIRSTPSLARGRFRTAHNLTAQCTLALAAFVGMGCENSATHLVTENGKTFAVMDDPHVRPAVVKTPAPVSAQPSLDEAGEIRNWSRTAALYHSGATEAWPTCWYYQPNPDESDVGNIFADPVMMVIQTASLPVTGVVDYPGRPVYYAGDVLPASYNAMPPVPPEPLRASGVPDPDPLVAPRPAYTPPLPVIPEEQPGLIVIPATAPTRPSAASQSMPASQELTTEPATTQAPTTQAPLTEPPATQVPATEPPATTLAPTTPTETPTTQAPAAPTPTTSTQPETK